MRNLNRSVVAFVGIVVLVAAASSCGDDSSGSGSTDLPEVPDSEFVDMTGRDEIVIDAKDNKFEAKFVTVSPGTKIVFENRGRNPHNVVPVEKDQFETITVEDFQPGATGTLVVEDDELYPYYCSLHGTATAGMDGRIRVEADS
ncbi:MAG: plastocyanin/azurin family copper-binding protein [Microthrixaceae bacterium]